MGSELNIRADKSYYIREQEKKMRNGNEWKGPIVMNITYTLVLSFTSFFVVYARIFVCASNAYAYAV